MKLPWLFFIVRNQLNPNVSMKESELWVNEWLNRDGHFSGCLTTNCFEWRNLNWKRMGVFAAGWLAHITRVRDHTLTEPHSFALWSHKVGRNLQIVDHWWVWVVLHFDALWLTLVFLSFHYFTHFNFTVSLFWIFTLSHWLQDVMQCCLMASLWCSQ